MTFAPQLLALVPQFESAEQQLHAMRAAIVAIEADLLALLAGQSPEDIEYARSALHTLLSASARAQQAFDEKVLDIQALWCSSAAPLVVQ